MKYCHKSLSHSGRTARTLLSSSWHMEIQASSGTQTPKAYTYYNYSSVSSLETAEQLPSK
jgi:hypothetical protein